MREGCDRLLVWYFPFDLTLSSLASGSDLKSIGSRIETTRIRG